MRRACLRPNFSIHAESSLHDRVRLDPQVPNAQTAISFSFMNAPELELTHRQEFSAAHRLHDEQLSDAQNAALYGPCNNPHGHGHTYVYEVTVKGAVPRSGMIIDLNVLRVIMREEVFDHVDHKHLDLDVPFMRGRISTAENLALAFWERIALRLDAHPGCRLHRIRVYEGSDSYVDCYGMSAGDSN